MMEKNASLNSGADRSFVDQEADAERWLIDYEVKKNKVNFILISIFFQYAAHFSMRDQIWET